MDSKVLQNGQAERQVSTDQPGANGSDGDKLHFSNGPKRFCAKLASLQRVIHYVK
jgi:hypothetical protein